MARRVESAIIALVVAAGCRSVAPTHLSQATSSREALRAIADRVAMVVRANGRLPRPDAANVDEPAMHRWNDSVDVWRRELRGVDTTRFGFSVDWVLYGVLREGLEANVGLRVCEPRPADRDACYRAMVRAVTGMPLTVDDLWRISIEEQQSLDRELIPFGERLVDARDPNVARQRLRNDAKFMARSREEILAIADTATTRTRERLSMWFTNPPSDPLVIRPETPENEANAPGGRYSGPTGRDTASSLVINTYKPEARGRADIVNAAVHEGWPGHHLQFAIARRAPAQHPVLAIFRPTGFVEGWAFYTERLADEMGVYTDDAARSFYRVHLADGALALRVDAALNTARWTRKQAIDTMMNVAGRQRWLAEVYAERHLTTRAQTVSYMLGYRTIMELRDEARRQLGQRFDIKRFHAVVLDDGPVTLPMLRRKVEHWIATGGG